MHTQKTGGSEKSAHPASTDGYILSALEWAIHRIETSVTGLLHYANAREVTHGENWSVSVTSFYCVNQRVHVSRKVTIDKKNVLPRTETWSTPSLCDGSCKAWKEKLLGMPEEIKKTCAEIMRTKPQQ